MKRTTSLLTIALALTALAEPRPVKYGDMDSWVTRTIKESRVIGGKTKQVYEIGPKQTIEGDIPYTPKGGSPWGTSNVMAKVVGVTKTSNAVYPADHPGHGKCARLCTELEKCKALGIVNIEVLATGSIFFGKMLEPITGLSNPYSKMEMGIPFTQKPKALVFDYKVVDPGTGIITRATTGSKSTKKGKDSADAYVYLQRRWEDANGNIHAKRVGTARERYSGNTDWQEGHRMEIQYGDITKTPYYKPYMQLLNGDRAYYARNSKGKMVPVQEEGWDSADATPTHAVVMFCSGSGVAYEGALGMELWIDNVAFDY